MPKRSEPPAPASREEMIGLGARSLRKSYYGDLQQRLDELARFRALLDHAGDAIVVAALPTREVVDANRAGRALLAARGAAVGEPLDRLFGEGEWRRIAAALEEPASPPVALWLELGGARHDLEVAARAEAFGGARWLVLVARDVTERAAAERALRAAKRAAEDAARARAEFLRTASHELRTPLAALKLLVELVERRARAGGASLDDLRRLARPLERLDVLVQDLLDVSRLDAGRVRLRRAPVDLARVAAEIADEARLGGREIVLDARPAVVPADAVRVAQVLANLLDNAVRYSPPGSPVAVRVGPAAGGAAASVVDHGPGIDPRDRPRLFTPFSRLGEARQGGEPGLGLGLHLSRRLAELHGGTLEYAPVASGGSEFVLWLPARRRRVRAEPREPAARERRGG